MTIAISEDGTNKQNCTFRHMNDMCLLNDVRSPTNIVVKVACDSAPCDVIFMAFQPKVSELELDKDRTVEAYHLYNVSQENALLEFLSNDTKI